MTPTELELAISAARDAVREAEDRRDEWADGQAAFVREFGKPEGEMEEVCDDETACLASELATAKAELDRLIALRTAPNPAQKEMFA